MKNLNRIIIGIIIGIGGFTAVVIGSGWTTAIGIILLLWSSNIENKYGK